MRDEVSEIHMFDYYILTTVYVYLMATNCSVMGISSEDGCKNGGCFLKNQEGKRNT